MIRFNRRVALAALAAMTITACGNAAGDGTSATATTSGTGLPDRAIGGADAPVTLIEYASVTCGHCAQFHTEVLPAIKQDYVETGKVRFVFREFPTPPQNVAIAGFAIARCAGDGKYFDVLDDLFENQPGMLAAARNGAVRSALVAVAERHGIAGTDAFEACLNDSAIRQDIADVVMSGEEWSINSTPTLVLQGRKLENTLESRTSDGLASLIDAELLALGVEPPARSDIAVDETTAPANE